MKWRVTSAVTRSTLPPPSRLLVFVLANRADSKTGVIPDRHTPSLAELALESGLSEATVKRHLASLEAAGWVRVQRPTAEQMARHVPNRYALAVGFGGSECAPEPDESGAQSELPAGAQSEPANENPGAQSEPSGGSECAPAGAQSEPPSYIPIVSDLSDLTTSADGADGEGDGALFPVADPAPRSEPERDPAERFAEFYKTYPRKKSPGRAEATWIKLVKAGAEPQVIIEAAERFAAWCKRTRQDPTYVPYPATWLNDRGWENEDDPASDPRASPNGHRPYLEDPDDDRPYAGQL
jgi:hypothetical protein